MKSAKIIALLLSICTLITVFSVFSGALDTYSAPVDDDIGRNPQNIMGNIVGDANGDCNIDLKDVLALRQYLANFDFDTYTAGYKVSENADANGDGAITVLDLTLMRRFIANKGGNTSLDSAEKISSFLASGTVIFKFGSEYAYLNGSRIEMSAPPIFDGEAYFPVDFIENNELGSISKNFVTTINGIEYTTAAAFTLCGKQVYTTNGESYTIVTDKTWNFGTRKEMYDDFALIAHNLFSIGTTFSAKMKGNRPVIFETDEMLSEAKASAAARVEPQLTSLQNVLKKANASLTTDPAPYTGESATQYRLAACNDFINARSLALAFYNTGNESYLNRAVEYLMAYADAEVRPGTDDHLDYSAATKDGQADIGLNIAVPLTTACDTYSLLYPYMTAAEKATFESWISEEVELVKKGHRYWIDNNYYGDQIGNNHLSSHLMGLICAAYALRDDALLTYAINSAANESNLLEMLDRAILMEGDTVYSADPEKTFTEGEVYDRYRVVDATPNGFGYAMYHLKFLTYSSLVMANNGLDMFNYVGTNGENLSLAYKTYSEYLIQNDSTLNGGYYSGNSLNRESSLTLYLIANRFYSDREIDSVITALANGGVVSGDNEQFGRSAGYIFGN